MHKLALILCVMSVSLAAQWLNYPTAKIPRLADGKPNLTAPERGTISQQIHRRGNGIPIWPVSPGFPLSAAHANS